MKEGGESGRVPWPSIVFILAWRFLVMPALSIPIIWVLAKKTGLLFDDPVLWFTMMMMPIGPPAMRLVALADVENLPQHAKMATAKLLTVSSPDPGRKRKKKTITDLDLIDFLCCYSIDCLLRRWCAQSIPECCGCVDVCKMLFLKNTQKGV